MSILVVVSVILGAWLAISLPVALLFGRAIGDSSLETSVPRTRQTAAPVTEIDLPLAA